MNEHLSNRGNYDNRARHDKHMLSAQIKEERGRVRNPRIAEQYDDLMSELFRRESDARDYESTHMQTFTRPSTIDYDLLNTIRKEIAVLQRQSWRMYKQLVCQHRHIDDHEIDYEYCDDCGAINYGVGWLSDEQFEVFHTPIVARIEAQVSLCQ